MPVRRVSDGAFSGYGSFGQIVTQPADLTKLNFRSEALNIYAVAPTTPPGAEPYAYIYAYIKWRWKIEIGAYNADTHKTYNRRLGKGQFGTVLTRSYGYNTCEEFVSYEKQMSEPKFCCVKFDVSNPEDPDNPELPCDEPPSDGIVTVVENALWASQGWLAALGSNSGAAGSHVCVLGDEVLFYPDASITRYLFGGSYQYSIQTLQRQQYDDSGRPPIINL